MSRVPLLALLLTALLGCAGTPWAEPVETAAAEASARSPLIEPVETPAAHAPAAPPPVEVLRQWDDLRGAAWARGDPRLLRSLYTPGSVAGRRDRAMLRAWTSRGLVVRGLQTQLLAVRELRRTAATWTLRVTDRLAGGTAVGTGVRLPLPTDTASTRILHLRLDRGRWRLSAVQPLHAGS